MTYDFSQFINDHRSQLESSDIPEYFWYYLFYKLNDETYDIGEVCDLTLNSDKTEIFCTVNKELKSSDGANIFLIDNAWTFEMDKAKFQLKNMDVLRERLATMLCLDSEESSIETVNNAIMDNIWSHARYFDITMKIPEERKKFWYILDEVGLYIKHNSETPSLRISPFIYVPNGVTYSVAWLIKDLYEGDNFTVNRVEHIIDPYLRECISYVWTRDLPTQKCNLKAKSSEFFTSHRILETCPDMKVANLGILDSEKRPVLVYSDVAFVKNTLSDCRYELTENREQADILWLFDHFKDFENLSQEKPRVLINQFPSETVMTIKDLLAALGSESDWIVKTFNLKLELAEFIKYFHESENLSEEIDTEQEDGVVCLYDCPCNCHYLGVDCGVCVKDKSCLTTTKNVDQVWIIKPWNLARGLGIFISQNIDHILRMVEAYPNEPKIASRYITDPVLFYRSDLGANVKFDIRYMILLTSVEPLKAYVLKIFWVRFSNKQFILSNWDDYETHFTVMNYKDGCELKNILCDEFVTMFDNQYPTYPWVGVEASIHQMLRNMLVDVTKNEDPLRITPSPQSRGMYAVDIMVEWNTTKVGDGKPAEICPRICEVNFCPDCTRACTYYPNFFNDIFNTLFFDEPTNVIELF